jgi:hypothetical protein
MTERETDARCSASISNTKRYYTEVRRGAPIDSGILSILHAVAYVRTCGFVEIYSGVLDA